MRTAPTHHCGKTGCFTDDNLETPCDIKYTRKQKYQISWTKYCFYTYFFWVATETSIKYRSRGWRSSQTCTTCSCCVHATLFIMFLNRKNKIIQMLHFFPQSFLKVFKSNTCFLYKNMVCKFWNAKGTRINKWKQ